MEEQGTGIPVFRTEFNVVGDHQDRLPFRRQPFQDLRQFLFIKTVQSLCRLIQKDDLWIKQKYFRQCRPLLFPAG